MHFYRHTGALCAMKEVSIIPDDPRSAECLKQLEQVSSLVLPCEIAHVKKVGPYNFSFTQKSLMSGHFIVLKTATTSTNHMFQLFEVSYMDLSMGTIF